MNEAERNPGKYIRPDGSPNKTALLRDLITVGLRVAYTERNDMEALKTLETMQTGAAASQPATPALAAQDHHIRGPERLVRDRVHNPRFHVHVQRRSPSRRIYPSHGNNLLYTTRRFNGTAPIPDS
jgi:hypothetical protein